MKQTIAALLAGMVFGIGLIVSGMTDPSKVQGFLDVFGAFDPSLALVMAGAVAVAFGAFRIAAKRPAALLGGAMRLPGAGDIDPRLVLGALAFGTGWGLAGFCPGPAVASLATGGSAPLIFVASMVAGMAIFELLERRVAKPVAT